jgi:hypothetical protein
VAESEKPPVISSIPPPARPRPSGAAGGPDESTWLSLLALGILLFLAGTYLGLVLAGTLPSAFGRSVYLYPVPFAFTIGGAVLAVYSYDGWNALRRDPERHRSGEVTHMPSFEVYRPPRRGRP